MNSLLGSDEDELEQDRQTSGDREISLGTTTLLGIFLALAVVCALFFGFGYTLGRHSAAAVAVSTAPGTASVGDPTAAAALSAKPGAGSPFGAGKPPRPAANGTPTAATVSAGRTLTPAPVASDAPAPGTAAALPRPATPSAAGPVPAPPAGAPALSANAPAAIVQVAAVSHREDAELLVSTLKHRGYNVAINTEPGDKLLHVQIGPFATRKDADAMRQKLLGDGFNAIVK